MDDPWLAPAFGDEPAGNDRRKADPPGVRYDPEVPARLEQNAAPHQPGPDQRRRHHEEAGRQHDAEGEEYGLHRRALLRRHLFEAEELSVQAMGEDQGSALRDRDREAVR